MPASEITITFDTDDLMSAIEATHESLARRLRWMIEPDNPMNKAFPWEVMAMHLKWLVNLMLRLRIAFRDLMAEWPRLDIEDGMEWFEAHDLPPAVREIFDRAMLATDWDEFEEHVPGGCEICVFMSDPISQT